MRTRQPQAEDQAVARAAAHHACRSCEVADGPAPVVGLKDLMRICEQARVSLPLSSQSAPPFLNSSSIASASALPTARMRGESSFCQRVKREEEEEQPEVTASLSRFSLLPPTAYPLTWL
eukprot:767615-Hanusia_phi.AAC.1